MALAPRYQPNRGFYTYIPGSRFEIIETHGRPIDVAIDEHGLRSSTPLESARIVVLGDSFVAALNTPIGETFAANLQRLTGISTYNAGVDGFSTFQATRLLQSLLEQGARPSTVILVFYLGNDFRDNLLDNARPSEVGWMASYGVARALGYHANPPPPVMRALRRTGAALEDLRALCAERGVRLLVVGIPARSEVYERMDDCTGRDREEIAACVRSLPVKPTFDAPDFRLRTILAAGGVQYVSLLAAFREQRGEGLYGERDPHWTPEGERLAAAIVATTLSQGATR